MRLCQIAVAEVASIHNQSAALFQVAQINLKCRRVHCHQHIRLVARSVNVIRRKAHLKTRHTKNRAYRSANLGRIVRERCDIVAQQRRGVGELITGKLHAIARVSGEANYNIVNLLQWDFLCGRHLADRLFRLCYANCVRNILT